MAIRAPMMKKPTAATDVFAIDTRGSSAATADGVVWHSGFPVDLAIQKNVTGVSSPAAYDRFRGSYSLFTDTTAAESNQGGHKFDSMNGFDVRTLSAATNQPAWMWKRAKGFMDVVAYTGTGANMTVPHSLGAVPEMMWIKHRSEARSWMVYHSGIGASKRLVLDTNAAEAVAGANYFQELTPTASGFYVGTANTTNGSGDGMLAYLFATVAGVSKVGSFVGNGTSQNIDCGFSSGARFVLLKNTSAAHGWHLFDATRGIVAGNDPYLLLNTNAAQYTNLDMIDPHNSGFTVLDHGEINGNGNTIIFYAIA